MAGCQGRFPQLAHPCGVTCAAHRERSTYGAEERSRRRESFTRDTVGEIAQFLGHLTKLRTHGRDDDPAARAAFLHRKAELFTRLTTDPALSTTPPAPAQRTP